MTAKEIVEKLAEKEINVSVPIVYDLLKIHGFKKRKLRKSKTIKEVKDRDEQFKKINMLRDRYMEEGEPVVSVDSKKKNLLVTSIEREKFIHKQLLKYMTMILLPCKPV